MMKNNLKSVDTLIELHKNRLNELKRQINELEEQRLNLTNKLKQLLSDSLAESEKYIGSEYVFMLDNYLKNVESNKKKFTEQIEHLELSIAKLRINISDNFTELKKFEIIKQNRLNRKNEQMKKDETKFFDEINIIKTRANC